MQQFIKKTQKWPYEVEMMVDGKIFPEKVILKAMYELVDKVYMFIKTKWNDYIVQFKLKSEVEEDLDAIVYSFGEELVFHRLRYDLDRKYWKLKEKIIETALWFGLSLEDIKKDLGEVMEKLKQLPSNQWQPQQEQPKSIDEIIKEIENDPDFADDKDEIISILKEIEEEEKDGKR